MRRSADLDEVECRSGGGVQIQMRWSADPEVQWWSADPDEVECRSRGGVVECRSR